MSLSIEHNIRIRYIIGLSAIALLVTASFFAMQAVISEQRNYYNLVKLASQQNATINRIAYFATLMVATEDENEFDLARSQLGRSMNLLKTTHEKVYKGSVEDNIPYVTNSNLQQIYDDPSVGLREAIATFLEHAQSIYDTDMEQLGPNTYAFIYLTTYGPHALEPMIKSALDEYEIIGREAIVHIEELEKYIWFAALVTLIFEVLLIFRPLENRIRESFKRLERAKRRNELAADSAGIGIWEWNLKTNQVIWDDWMFRLYDLKSNGNEQLLNTWKQRVYFADRDKLFLDLEHLSRSDTHYETEFRIVVNDQIHWIKINATVLFDKNYEAQRLIGTNRDISLEKEAQEALINQQEVLERTVKERTLELEIAKDKAEAANNEKSRFLSNMSHELRTPMHAISSFTHLALKRDQDSKTQRYLENVNVSARRLTELLNGLLDLAKLEAGKMDLNYSENDINLVFKEHVESLRSLLIEKSIDVQYDVQTSAPFFCSFDDKLIGQVIINLLSNAVKFCKPGGVIIIQIAKQQELEKQSHQDCLHFAVIDQGVGIPAGELDTIFDVFVQSSKTVSKAGGTGLGLPLAKEIIDLHGGKIWVVSPSMGGANSDSEYPGTEVHVQIPCEPPARES